VALSKVLRRRSFVQRLVGTDMVIGICPLVQGFVEGGSAQVTIVNLVSA
jgi:hypothetical protein